MVRILLRGGDTKSQQTMLAHMNYKRIDKISDTALTITARDYKGFGTGTQVQNGVIIYD